MIVNNIVIVGAGPAGLTCSIYASRAGMSPVVIAGDMPGGQLVQTDCIENFPGFHSISGPDLMMKMIEQVENIGAQIIFDTVSNIEKNLNGFFNVTLSSGEKLETKTVVIASGAKHKHLSIPGEIAFTNKGVSWCATCDGPMYKGKKVAVVGGGNTALTEALFLSNFTDEVSLIHRRDSFRADKLMQTRVLKNSKIKVVWNSVLTEICGDDKLTHVILNGEERLKISGLFISVGTSPSTNFAKNIVECDENEYIKAIDTITSCRGIFAAGDVVGGSLKQAVFAAGQGALAFSKIEEYLEVR